MKRVASRMKLIPGFEEEYQKRHDEIWPVLSNLLGDAGIHQYSIFLDEEDGSLFATMNIEDDLLVKNLADHPVMKKWWAYMKDIMETNPDNSPVSIPLKEVFYLP